MAEASKPVSTKYNLPKPESHHKSMLPTVGGPSLISMNDEDWKFWRRLLKFEFHMNNMMDRVPDVRAAEIQCDELWADTTRIFSLTDFTTQLTMDVITTVIL